MLGREKGPECVDASAWGKATRKSTRFHDYWQAKEANVLLPLERCREALRRWQDMASPAVCAEAETRYGYDYMLEACVRALRSHCGRAFIANGRKFMATYPDAAECLAAERVLPPTP